MNGGSALRSPDHAEVQRRFERIVGGLTPRQSGRRGEGSSQARAASQPPGAANAFRAAPTSSPLLPVRAREAPSRSLPPSSRGPAGLPWAPPEGFGAAGAGCPSSAPPPPVTRPLVYPRPGSETLTAGSSFLAGAPSRLPPGSLTYGTTGGSADVAALRARVLLGASDVVDPFLGHRSLQKVEDEGSLAMAAVFPALFTLFCLAAFIMPIWTAFHVGQDPNVQFWIGRYPAGVALLPAVYVAVQALHHACGGPVKLAVLACLVGSPMVLILIGNTVAMESYRLGTGLSAKECSSLPGKQELESQWREARSFYAACISGMAFERNVSLTSAVLTYRIQDCPDYLHQGRGSWTYLRFLEEHYQCAGWCKEQHALWTVQDTKDACSTVVANVMLGPIQWSMMQVTVCSLAALGLVSGALAAGVPAMQRLGVAW